MHKNSSNNVHNYQMVSPPRSEISSILALLIVFLIVVGVGGLVFLVIARIP